MATRALPLTTASPPGDRRWAAHGLALAPPFIIAAGSLIELLLADRKFGLFSGGFGMSRAVEAPVELALFAAGYLAAQALAGLLGWFCALWLTRGKPWWTPVFVFALVNGALFVAVLAARYQLASYFSDAVGFALLTQLGGGSLVDALLFGLTEVGVAAGGLALLGLSAWLVWKLLGRVLTDERPRPAAPGRRAWALVPLLFVILAFAVPRSGSDAAYALNRTLAWGAASSLLDLASDVDRDGYGLFGVQHDGAPLDAARHPLALDVPGNGVDEDGYGGDLALAALTPPLPAQVFTGKRPHVVVVVLESTRGDVLGRRVDGQPVAPQLEALARGGSVAAPAYSHVGFTTESLKSLFSGLLAPRKGDPSLLRDLKASGYRIGVFSGQPENFGGISDVVGTRASADIYVDAETLRDKRAFDFAAEGSLLVDESHLLAAFDRTLGREDWRGQPHFAYFNFQSAHFPYDHPGLARRLTDRPLPRGEISAANATQVRETYWNAVANADRWLGEVIARLKAKGVWDDTILIVTGDHGEELFESGFLGHGHVINPQQFQTLLVANRAVLPPGPIGLADYRAIVAAAIRGQAPPRPAAAPFMHIGPLDTPTAIGLAGAGGQLTSVRLDTGEACFLEQRRCAPYARLAHADRARVDAVIARWGSERWRDRTRRP